MHTDKYQQKTDNLDHSLHGKAVFGETWNFGHGGAIGNPRLNVIKSIETSISPKGQKGDGILYRDIGNKQTHVGCLQWEY